MNPYRNNLTRAPTASSTAAETPPSNTPGDPLRTLYLFLIPFYHYPSTTLPEGVVPHDQSILIPTDGSAYSKVALEYGIYLAEKFRAKITGLHVVDDRDLEGPLLSDIAGSLGFTPYQNHLPKFRKILEDCGDLILDGVPQRM